MPKEEGRTLTSLVARKLKRDITTGRVKPGQPLPSEDELCRKYGVSRVTVRRSLGRLRSERLLISRPGVGHFVLPLSGSSRAAAGATDILYVHDLGRTGGVPGPVSSAVFSGAVEESARHGLDVMQCCLAPERLRTVIAEKSGTTLRGVLFDWNDPALARFMIERGVPFVVVEGDFDDIPVA
ncbi:MAG: winged helix-turn-helix domain-containing protein, partial [Planctomycetota bacterium]